MHPCMDPSCLPFCNSDLNINKMKSQIYKWHRDFSGHWNANWQEETSRRSPRAVGVGRERWRSVEMAAFSAHRKQEPTLSSGDQGIRVQTWSRKRMMASSQAIPWRSRSNVLWQSQKPASSGRMLKNKIESTSLWVLAYTHTYTHKDTRIHLLQKYWVEFQSLNLKDVIMKLEPHQRRSLKIIKAKKNQNKTERF